LSLISLNNSLESLQRETDISQKKFEKLSEDIEAGNLKSGLSKQNIQISYGDPVLVKKIDSYGQEEWLYRSPLEYFDTLKAYLVFDKEEKLLNWRTE
jgi:outer membrane protein assembly factor BamE (lipoprotein component of BamABCDE complex)